jgi:hypothetical protein
MLFGKLLPREGNFFEMFNQHADRIVEAARAFSNLVANYSDPHLRDKYNQDVDNAERAADRVTHDVNKMLHKTFITPIDREQIHKLINTMDDVADLIQDSAETMALYDVHHMTEEITRLTDLSVKCCERVKDAVRLLARSPTGDCRSGAEDLRGDRPAGVGCRPRDAQRHEQAVPRGAGRARGDQAQGHLRAAGDHHRQVRRRGQPDRGHRPRELLSRRRHGKRPCGSSSCWSRWRWRSTS